MVIHHIELIIQGLRLNILTPQLVCRSLSLFTIFFSSRSKVHACIVTYLPHSRISSRWSGDEVAPKELLHPLEDGQHQIIRATDTAKPPSQPQHYPLMKPLVLQENWIQ